MTHPTSIDRDQILRFVLEREQDGTPLNASAVHADVSALYNAARTHFGSWRKALEAAGLNPEKVSRIRSWDQQRVIDHISRLAVKGKSLRRRDVAKKDQGLLAVAHKFFGSWRSAIEAAGIDASHHCLNPAWEREQIIEAILMRVVKREPLGSTTVRPHSLKMAAVREFGSWAAALQAAGLEPADYIGSTARFPGNAPAAYHTQEDVKKALLQRAALGQACNHSAIMRQDRPLFRAILRLFGSCGRAAEYAGLATIQTE